MKFDAEDELACKWQAVVQKWDKQFDTLLAQIKERAQKEAKLEEIRIIIQNRTPSLHELDWDSWLSDPLNLRLAELDFERAMEMFKRDKLMAARRCPPRGRGTATADRREAGGAAANCGDRCDGRNRLYVDPTRTHEEKR